MRLIVARRRCVTTDRARSLELPVRRVRPPMPSAAACSSTSASSSARARVARAESLFASASSMSACQLARSRLARSTRRGIEHRAGVGLVDGAPERARGSYLNAKFWRLARRRGRNKAAVTVAHSILVAAYFVLRDDVDYNDLGGDWFTRRQDTERRLRWHIAQLEALGRTVTLNCQPALTASDRTASSRSVRPDALRSRDSRSRTGDRVGGAGKTGGTRPRP
jgi:hypothetical protein